MIVILILHILKDGDKFYLQLFLEEAFVVSKLAEIW